MARPKLDIKGEEVQKLASFGCTNVEIADFFNCNEATIRKSYSEYLTKGRSMKKLRLRQIQWKIAENGNAAMAIWLGKNELGQSDSGNIADDNQPLPFSVD
jgi:DNA-binding NarL/FixJ family response regulator